MYEIKKEFHFSAGHVLCGLPKDHPCGRLHGHNYIITVCLKSDKLNDVGFVQDYGELNKIKAFIDDFWDHRHLNDLVPFNPDMMATPLNPSAENMAKYLYDRFKKDYPLLYSITVSETPKTVATYYE